MLTPAEFGRVDGPRLRSFNEETGITLPARPAAEWLTECHCCGYEAGGTQPGSCPKCNGASWERYRRAAPPTSTPARRDKRAARRNRSMPLVHRVSRHR